MSQLLDSLRRARQRSKSPRAKSPEDAERTARADAVLATLGYKAKSSSRLTPVLLIVAAVGLAVVWSRWPRPAPAPAPTTTVRRPSAPATKPPATKPPAAAPQQAPAQVTAPPIKQPAPVPAPMVATRPPEPVTPAPTPPSRPAGAPAATRPPSRTVQVVPPAPAATDSKPAAPASPVTRPAAPATPSAELFRLAVSYQRSGDFARAETNYRELLQRNELDAQVHNKPGPFSTATAACRTRRCRSFNGPC
jgi:hypothetical protein